MKANKNIEAAAGKFKILLTVFIVFQTIAFLIINSLLSEFDTEAGSTGFLNVKNIIRIICIVFFVIVDVVLWQTKIKRLAKLVHVQPIKCIVEDMIVTSYRVDGKRKYKIDFLVKSLENNQLYFTFGKYEASYYTVVSNRMNNALLGISAIRKDKSPVDVGDMVYIYINKLVDIAVDVDRMSDTVKLEGNKFVYEHANKNYNASVFENVNFFDGVVEIETDI